MKNIQWEDETSGWYILLPILWAIMIIGILLIPFFIL